MALKMYYDTTFTQISTKSPLGRSLSSIHDRVTIERNSCTDLIGMKISIYELTTIKFGGVTSEQQIEKV